MHANLDDSQLLALFASARDLEIAPDELDAARARITHMPSEGPSGPSAHKRRRSWRAIAPLALPVAGIVALTMLIAGVFSGPGSTGEQPVLAAVIRAVETTKPLRPGTIVVYTTRTRYPINFNGEAVAETPAGTGAQNSYSFTSDPRFGAPAEQAISGGEEEFYLKSTNTIYIASIWGPYITKGTTPGTFIYTAPKESAGSKTLQPKPLTLTTQQAQALLNGVDTIASIPMNSSLPYTMKLEVRPAKQASGWPQAFRLMLRSRQVRILGYTTTEGRSALELAGPIGRPPRGNSEQLEVWLDPKTFLPIKIVDRSRLVTYTQVWLPITSTTERLLSLIARHPRARTDRNYKDYLKAANGYNVYPR